MPHRLNQLEHWLGHTLRLPVERVEPASADASFRRYFRVLLEDGSTRVAMDAPPDKEDCGPFIAVAGRMAAAGLHVPRIHAQDLAQGFILLEDLGSRSYLDALDDDTVDGLYGDAMVALLHLQRAPVEGLPPYDRSLLEREMALFPDWLLERHLGLDITAAERAMLDQAFEALVANALAQPVVCVHRDYHSRNLMLATADNPGILDFQDAVEGPLTYDLVSLLKDCYVRWPAEQVLDWAAKYYGMLDAALRRQVDEALFLRYFELMGVQRHLKAAGIFARLNHRDHKPGYMADVPRTLDYIVELGPRHPQLEPLIDLITSRCLPKLRGTA